MLKQLKVTKNTLKARRMIIPRELRCLGMKQKCENIRETNIIKWQEAGRMNKLDTMGNALRC